MTVAGEALLLPQLADPLRRAQEIAQPEGAALEKLYTLASGHGVLPILERKLGLRATEAGPDTALRVGQTLLLEQKAERVSAALREAGVRFAIVKGPTFARLLYENPADRPFTDIDLLLHPTDLDRASEVMRERGFQLEQNEVWDNSQRNMEFKWTLVQNRSVLFELHTNLVHYPRLRRRVSFGYEELLAAGQGDGEAPEALLSVAIIHASCGHKFHRLQMVVDVLQAARRLPDDRIDNFVHAAQKLRFSMEAAVSLSLAGRLFEDRRATMIAKRLGGGALSAIGCRLISPDCAIQALDPRHRGSWTRRKAFRLIQYLHR